MAGAGRGAWTWVFVAPLLMYGPLLQVFNCFSCPYLFMVLRAWTWVFVAPLAASAAAAAAAFAAAASSICLRGVSGGDGGGGGEGGSGMEVALRRRAPPVPPLGGL